MTDPRFGPAGWAGVDPADTAEREARHQVVIDLLAAYADAELPPETVSQIDAHLVGCARCRRELDVHRAVGQRLAAAPLPAASPAFRERVAAAVAALPVPPVDPAVAPAGHPQRGPSARGAARRQGWSAGLARPRSAVPAVLSVLLLVAALYTAREVGGRRSEERTPAAARVARLAGPTGAVPLLGLVLADYRRVMAGDLPGRARDLAAVRAAMPFAVEPMSGAGLRLLAAWTTSFDGDPAAVLAYRWGDRVVLEYLVAEELLFRHPEVRRMLATQRVVATADGTQGLVVWAEPTAGAILVGDGAPERLVEALAR